MSTFASLPRKTFSIVSIAASAGSVFEVTQILSQLPADFPLPILYQQDVSKNRAQQLVTSLKVNSPLKICWAKDNDRLVGGTVYVSPPGFWIHANDTYISLIPVLRVESNTHHLNRFINSVVQNYGQKAIIIALTDDALNGFSFAAKKNTLLLIKEPVRDKEKEAIYQLQKYSGLILPTSEIGLGLRSLVERQFPMTKFEPGLRLSLSRRGQSKDELKKILNHILDLSLLICHTRKGNLQLLDRDNGELRIVTQRGFSSEFVKHFWIVKQDDGSACARALKQMETVIIHDVSSDPLFTGHLTIADSAGFSSVISIPLISHGNIVGVLSVHFNKRFRMAKTKFRLLREYINIASNIIYSFTAGKRQSIV